MATETDIQSRIERARERELDVSVESEEPMVVTVYSEHSDRIHTIVPSVLHCSCEDKTYRDTLCYHLIFLAIEMDENMVPEEVRTTVRNAITDELKEMQEREMELRAELREIAEERESMQALRDEMPMRDYGLGGSPGAEVLEPADGVLDDEEIDAEEIVEELEEEASDEFRQMVDDLSQSND